MSGLTWRQYDSTNRFSSRDSSSTCASLEKWSMWAWEVKTMSLALEVRMLNRLTEQSRSTQAAARGLNIDPKCIYQWQIAVQTLVAAS